MTAQLLTSQSSFTRADMGALPAEGRDLVADLRRVVQGEVRFDGYTRMLYSTDASQYQIKPIGVVIPKTIADVQATVELAAKRGVPVLPRGGGSSLAGQAVGAAIVIDFSKYMNQVVNVDADAQTATVQPGINFASLNTQMGKHGLMIGPDPARRLARSRAWRSSRMFPGQSWCRRASRALGVRSEARRPTRLS